MNNLNLGLTTHQSTHTTNNSKKFNFSKTKNKARSLRHFSKLSGVILFFLLITNDIYSQGNLLITPRRVVFEGSKKVQELNLANIGKDTARYVLSMVEIRMREDGSFEKITAPDSGQKFASPYLRFFPRSVVLGPNESQLLKVQLSKADQLTAGEYRSHIYFRAERDDKPLGEIEARVDSGSISVSIIPIFGITIPIIIRTGDVHGTASLSDASFIRRDSLHLVSLTMHRSGDASIYGNFKVNYFSPEGKETKIGQANGVAVYTPNEKRHFEIKLQTTAGIDFGKGKLKVQYVSDSDANPEVLSEIMIDLQK